MRTGTQGGPLLVASNLAFGYGEADVLTGVNLACARGEMLGVIGPNGAGKSTLVRLLCGVLRPRRGRVVLAGRDIDAYPRRELARRVAVVPQQTAIAFPFTVLEVVLMGRAPHLGRFGFPAGRDLAVARAALGELGLGELGGRSLDQLSGGERQRVIIARALAQEPELLLLDEPTAHLDLHHQVEILELVARLRTERGLGVIAVLHDLNLAAMYCDRLCLLARGRCERVGAPAEVLTYPLLRAAYGAEVHVSVHEVTGTPVVVPLRPQPLRTPGRPAAPRGGGPGGRVR